MGLPLALLPRVTSYNIHSIFGSRANIGKLHALDETNSWRRACITSFPETMTATPPRR